MKKIFILPALLAVSGCYTSVPPAQDIYVEPYTAPTVYYTYSQAAMPTTYVIEQTSPDIVYVDSTPSYVYLDNPLIYGRPHHHYHHAISRPQHHHHTAPKPHHHNTPAKRPHKEASHGNHHQGKPIPLTR